MSSTFAVVAGREFAQGVVIDDENKVLAVDSTRFPTLNSIQVGSVVRSINSVPTVRAKEEQKQYQTFAGEIMIVLAPQTRDEFDLSSDEDDAGEFKPASALPPLPAECNNAVAGHSATVILEAARKVAPGKCIIIMCEGANPALPITLAAEKAKADVMYIDTVARMKTRQRIGDAGEMIKRSLEKGLWIYLEQATKSITLLRKLADCITEVEATRKMHASARVFLMCEPHPHFPETLMRGCVTLRSRLQGDNTAEVDVKEDMLESMRRRNFIHGTEANITEGVARNVPEVTPIRKKVKISNEVNIVHLEASTFMEMSASAHPPIDRDNITGEGLTRVAKYSFGSGEKFISLCKMRDHRFAVGTNSGYVVLLDGDGLPLIQFRPHKACVWDVSFASPFDFSTACEDGTSTIFNYSLACQELTTTSVASFQSDVFAVTYADDSDVSSAVLSGGLSATICVLHSDRQTSSFIASGTSIQAMCATRRKHVIVGGGNGACSLIDPSRCVVMDSTSKHTRKVPAVSCHGDIAVTGGFDRMVRIWDVRSGFQLTCERTIDHFITAVAVSDKMVAVCGGSELFVWDLRKMTSPLATKHNAWKDLTRGLVIDEGLIVTASVDGVARFWEVN